MHFFIVWNVLIVDFSEIFLFILGVQISNRLLIQSLWRHLVSHKDRSKLITKVNDQKKIIGISVLEDWGDNSTLQHSQFLYC